MPAPEARLRGTSGHVHLTSCFGAGFVVLYFAQHGRLPDEIAALAAPGEGGPAAVRVICIASQGEPDVNTLVDESGQARERYGAADGSAWLVRPDGYLMGCWTGAPADAVQAALKPFQQHFTAGLARPV